MQTKQKVILGCTLAVTLIAPLTTYAAVTIAASDTPSATTVTAGTASLGGFTTSDFQFTPSRSVAVKADGSTTTVAVQTGTNRGSRRFGGSSNGGSVKECGASEATPGTSVAAPTVTATSTGCN
jgi:hypothetical protein